MAATWRARPCWPLGGGEVGLQRGQAAGQARAWWQRVPGGSSGVGCWLWRHASWGSKLLGLCLLGSPKGGRDFNCPSPSVQCWRLCTGCCYGQSLAALQATRFSTTNHAGSECEEAGPAAARARSAEAESPPTTQLYALRSRACPHRSPPGFGAHPNSAAVEAAEHAASAELGPIKSRLKARGLAPRPACSEKRCLRFSAKCECCPFQNLSYNAFCTYRAGLLM